MYCESQVKTDLAVKELALLLEKLTREGVSCLRIIYVLDPNPESVFVITAYELTGKPLKAYRRRLRRKTK